MYFIIYICILLGVYIAVFSSEIDSSALEKASPFIAVCVIGIVLSLIFSV